NEAGDGSIYAAGSAQGAGQQHWIVRKEVRGSTSWNTVDDFSPSEFGARALSIKAAPTGEIYVAGARLATTGSVWTVRKSSDHGQSWSTVDVVSVKDGQSEGTTVAADSTGNIWVGGT